MCRGSNPGLGGEGYAAKRRISRKEWRAMLIVVTWEFWQQ
jgi:hypothetical protein